MDLKRRLASEGFEANLTRGVAAAWHAGHVERVEARHGVGAGRQRARREGRREQAEGREQVRVRALRQVQGQRHSSVLTSCADGGADGAADIVVGRRHLTVSGSVMRPLP